METLCGSLWFHQKDEHWSSKHMICSKHYICESKSVRIYHKCGGWDFARASCLVWVQWTCTLRPGHRCKEQCCCICRHPCEKGSSLWLYFATWHSRIQQWCRCSAHNLSVPRTLSRHVAHNVVNCVLPNPIFSSYANKHGSTHAEHVGSCYIRSVTRWLRTSWQPAAKGVRLGHVLLDALGSPAQNAQREVSRGVTARALHVLRGTFLFGCLLAFKSCEKGCVTWPKEV